MARKTKTTSAPEPGDDKREIVVVSAPRIDIAVFRIVGTSPYVQNRFSSKAREMMREQQEAGQSSRSKKKRGAKDFEAAAKDATHFGEGGWYGIPASAFRWALIDVCRLVGVKMTFAKLSVFIEADGFDREDGTPLVKIKGKPEMNVSPVINSGGSADLRPRPMWRQWSATLRVQFDREQFTAKDVANLLVRAGIQNGIGAGRPNSKKSIGCGWGTFRVETA